MKNLCKCCSKEVNSYSSVFCSNACHKKYQAKYYILDYLDGVESGTNNVGMIVATVRSFVWERAERACEECGWNRPHPLSGKPPLEIHHKDGNGANNRPENLQLLCPNCHSLTTTFRNRNEKSARTKRKRPTCTSCGGPASSWGTRCRNCVERRTKIAWPELGVLKQQVDEKGYAEVGRMLGVSDNAVRSHIRRRM